jgi:integral membrane protein (TIGR01906 family)
MKTGQNEIRARWAVARWLAAIALALLLVTTNVRITANSLWLYEQLFERNEVPLRTGISMPVLRDIGEQIQDYFANDTEPLEVVATLNGVEVTLFGQDEVSHMADVKQMFGRTYLVQTLSAVVLVVVGLFTFFNLGRNALKHVAFWVERGALMASSVITIIGSASLVAFDQVFLLFHFIGFPQGNFTFNSRTAYLVRVFPNGFWEDITFAIGALTLIESVLLFGIVFALKRRAAKKNAAS